MRRLATWLDGRSGWYNLYSVARFGSLQTGDLGHTVSSVLSTRLPQGEKLLPCLQQRFAHDFQPHPMCLKWRDAMSPGPKRAKASEHTGAATMNGRSF